MEKYRYIRRFRSGLVILFSLLSVLNLYGIEAELKDHIIENQRFTLKYITSFQGRQQVQITDPLWPDNIDKISGPYTAQRTIQKEDGSYATVLQVIYTLRAKKAGIYNIPPLLVQAEDEVQRNEGIHFPVLQKDESFLNFPLILEWQNIPDSLYVGQAYPLVLEMHNLEEISLPDSISINTPEGAILETAQGVGDILYNNFDETTLFHVPMESWMITPSRAGTLVIDKVRVDMLGLRRETEKQSIEIKALPEAVSETGAIGDFKYTAILEEGEFSLGESLSLSLKIQGRGNLNYLVIPEPVFPDDLSVGKKEFFDFTSTTSGFEGSREIQYTLTPRREGDFAIAIPAFSWLNDKTGRIFSNGTQELEFRILSIMESLEDDSHSFDLIPYDELGKYMEKLLYQIPILYLFLIPGFAFFLITRNRKIRTVLFFSVLLGTFLFSSSSMNEESSKQLENAQIHYENGDYDQALILYEREDRNWHDNPAYLYNKGLLYFLNSRNSEAIASLRSALYIRPSDSLFRKTLLSIEKSLELEHQLESGIFLNPDFLFILFLILFNLFFVILSLPVKRSRHLFLLLTCLVFILFTSGELIRSAWILSQNTAVLRDDMAIRKIPEYEGSPWINLSEGTAVKIIEKHKDFILVRTAYGLEGWLHGDDLILFREAED